MITPETTKDVNQSDHGVLSLIQKLREKLKLAAKELFPFFEACTSEIRNYIAKNGTDIWILEWDPSEYKITYLNW